jgi:hypothetical protein
VSLSADQKLVDYVQGQVRAGRRTIELPIDLVQGASKEVLREIRAYCKINGVSISRIADSAIF